MAQSGRSDPFEGVEEARPEEPEFTYHDIPDDLNISSVLVEVIEHVEALKENLPNAHARDSELLNVIK